VVPPALGFEDLAGHDREADTLAFTAAPDPTRNVVMVVRGGGAPEEVPLPGPPANHRAVLSERGGALVVTRVSEAAPARTSVVGLDGKVLAELPSVAEEPPVVTNLQLRKVGPGEGLWTALVLPRRPVTGPLPVILDVYGGPSGPGAVHAPMLLQQWLADQGFAVVHVDGRGTGRRGRAWSRAIRGFGDGILDDQVAGLRALAEAVPGVLDLARVGATGWSFGGWTAAAAVLRRPDVFRAAVAGAPVVEWRDYDTHYTERYLGLPATDREAYDRSSLLADAPRLSRPLLLVHGTADDNVWFSHSLRLADALFRAGRPFDLLPVGGATHMVPDPTASMRVRQATAAFLARHVGATPPSGGAAPAGPSASTR
jgi:dipeptidyl-peptidase-4